MCAKSDTYIFFDFIYIFMIVYLLQKPCQNGLKCMSVKEYSEILSIYFQCPNARHDAAPSRSRVQVEIIMKEACQGPS